MKKQKTKKVIIIISIIVLLLLIIGIFTALYLTTDMFKSNEMLFAKYLGQNIENFDTIKNEFFIDEVKEFKEGKYSNNTEIEFNYIDDVGTSNENADNIINSLKLQINGSKSKEENYNYKKMNLLKNDENLLSLEYINVNNEYGIRFSDLYKQFVIVENENLTELQNKIGNNSETIKLPENIDFNINVQELFNLSQEEKKKIQEKYLNVIINNTTKENFSKQKNSKIQVNNQEILADSYTLTLTKEQLNDIYIKFLEEIKKDDIILGKIEKIEQNIVNYGIEYDFKNEFINSIDETIQNIISNNIGSEETKIIVYVKNGYTLKTVIQVPEYEIEIDSIKSQYLKINYYTLKNQTNLSIKFLKENDNKNLEIIRNYKDEDIKTLNINKKTEVVQEEAKVNSTIKYEDNSNKLNIESKQILKKLEEVPDKIVLDDENSIKLNDLNETQMQNLLNGIEQGITSEYNEFVSRVNGNEIVDMLYNLGIIKETVDLDFTNQLSQTEIDRFNAQFELIKGEKIKNEDVLKNIEAIKNYIINIEKNDENEIKIKIDMNQNNLEKANEVYEIVSESKKDYDISAEYDEENGLIKYIVLKINEEK